MKHILSVLTITIIFFACSTREVETTTSINVSDKEATSSLQQYYSTLHKRMTKGIMLGHQDALAYGSMWYGDSGRSDVKSVCGDYPAVVGWDLGQIEVGSTFNLDSVAFAKIKKFTSEMNTMNGVTTFNWTAHNPAGEETTTIKTISSILPGNANHNTYISYLDKVADFLLNLKNENGEYIPIIFRPFNDPETTDLWWNVNDNSKDDYKALWRMTVDYLRNTRKVHHVLYAFSVYSPKTEADYSEFYPGDAYVDIVGVNIYLELDKDVDGSQYKKDLDNGLKIASNFSEKHGKIVALTDTGLKGIKLSNFFSSIVTPIISNYEISYVLFGRNAWNIEDYYHIPIPGHPASDDFGAFAANPRILTRTKLDAKS